MSSVSLNEQSILGMLTCETVAVAAFVSTIDSVSAPCGLLHNYWDALGGNHLQNMDAATMLLRGMCWLATFTMSVVPNLDVGRGFVILYAVVAAGLFVISLVTSWDSMDLDCPNSDNTMSCTGGATYWMVPRNYCEAQIVNNDACLVDEPERTQMCVRLGRAPLVNGAFAAWLVRTLLVDALRLFLLVYYGITTTPERQELSGDGGNAGSDERRALQRNDIRERKPDATSMLIRTQHKPSTQLHEQDTLLQRDEDVIRQSPHIRKRAASAYDIQF